MKYSCLCSGSHFSFFFYVKKYSATNTFPSTAFSVKIFPSWLVKAKGIKRPMGSIFDFAKSGETARVTGTVAPESYRVSAPDIFACSQVQVSAPLIFNDSNASLADTSIFKKYNLEEDICNKEESARGEAEKYGLLKNAYFVVNETDRKMVHVTQPPDANSCATWEVDSDQSIPKVYRGEHNQGIVPAECKQSATGQNTCITTPGTVKVVNKSNDPYLNLNDQAVKTLKTTFGAFYGGADTATVVCAKDAKNCLDTKVVLDPVSKIVTASASINVKLYTENFPIIGDSIKAIGVVTEKQMQPWEGKFASGRY